MPVTNKEYYKRELGYAADLISGRLKLWMSLYESGERVLYRVWTEQLVRAANRGRAPVIYGAILGLNLNSLSDDEFDDLIDDDQGIVWLGDIAENGDVLCGDLLTAMVASERLKNQQKDLG